MSLIERSKSIVKVCSYNCKNLKANTLMISKLIQKYNICFIIEHWLSKQEKNEFVKIAKEKNVLIYHADYDIEEFEKKLGRPFGGLCMIVEKHYQVVSCEILNENVVKAELIIGNTSIIVIGVWMPFYSTSDKSKLYTFKSNISLLENELKTHQNVIIMGDWNSDTNRKNPCDQLFKSFIESNQLINATNMLVNKNEYTYKNGEYYSNIDHIVINRKASSNIIHSEIIIDNLDMSDHRPIVAKFEFDAERLVEQSNPTTKQFHKFQWKDIKFKDLYAMKITRILNENKNEFNFNGNVEELIDENLNKLIKFQIKAAREAEKEISKERKTVSNKNMTTHQNHQIQAHVASIDRLNQQANISNVFKVYKIKEIKRL